MPRGRLQWLIVIVALAACWLAAGCSSSKAPAGSTATAAAAGATGTPASSAPPIPAKYQSLYANLSKGLDAYQAAIDGMPDNSAAGVRTVAAVELLPANGNRLEELLAPQTLPSTDQWLD